jgi:hypothetical protein
MENKDVEEKIKNLNLVEGKAQYETFKGLESTIRSAAEEEALKKNTSKKKKDWYDAECELAICRKEKKS